MAFAFIKCVRFYNLIKALLGLSNGILTYLDDQSSEQTLTLPSHNAIDENNEKAVHQLLNLCQYRKALQLAIKLNDRELIHKVGEQSLNGLNVEVASEAFTQTGDAATFNIIQPIYNENEYSYLHEYVSMMNHDYNTAQKNFLNSSRPETALNMRAALLQFDYAIKLVEKFDPSRIYQLSYDSARQNEITGNYSTALKLYQESIKCQEFAHSSRAGIIWFLFFQEKLRNQCSILQKYMIKSLF